MSVNTVSHLGLATRLANYSGKYGTPCAGGHVRTVLDLGV